MNEYNGFNGKIRLLSIKIHNKAMSLGIWNYERSCELCGKTEADGYNISPHVEDYSKPLEDNHPLCKSCHTKLHQRFMYPNSWQTLLKIFSQTNQIEYYKKLPLSPIDLVKGKPVVVKGEELLKDKKLPVNINTLKLNLVGINE